jgi:peptidoglycan hydrolase-like protein with peptidoglycan-binding domain
MLRPSRATLLAAFLALAALPGFAQDRVRTIAPPATPLPAEADSSNVTRYSFVVYGDNRGRQDGTAIQYEHSNVMDAIIAQIKRQSGTEFPTKFVLQSGDSVLQGQNAVQWNTSFNPIVERLTKSANVPYFAVPGNHDVGAETTHNAPRRQAGLRNFYDAMGSMIPAEGTPHRLNGYPAYGFGYGNSFFLGIDSNIAGDETQFAWTKSQLEGLDRTRYKHVFVFFHQNVFSSGPHGGGNVEAMTLEIRNRYMPLFRQHHVDTVFSGHEHFFEHWVEHYRDVSGAHRLDLVLTGGGGAPLYTYQRVPDTRDYLRANASIELRLEQLAKPGMDPGSNPYHFVLVRVDGDKINMEVIGADWGVGYQPYKTSQTALGGN